jgi:hypothetical protein
MKPDIIKDLSNNEKPNNDSNFIKVNIKLPLKQLDLLTFNNDESIWTLSKTKINEIMKEYSKHSYYMVSDIWIPYTYKLNEVDILFVRDNPEICCRPDTFEKVQKHRDGFLWKPVLLNDPYTLFVPFGVVYSESFPDVNRVRMISIDYVIPYRGRYFSFEQLCNLNEFYCLGVRDMDKLTIDKTKIYPNNSSFFLKSKLNNSYIFNEDNKILFTNDSTNKPKTEYNDDGNIKFNDSCLTVDSYSFLDGYNKGVYMRACDQDIGQKWYFQDDKVISAFNDMCLTNNEGSLMVDLCEKTDFSQKWNRENEQTTVRKPKEWKRGSKVILVENDNPWYLNKDTDAIPLNETQFSPRKNKYYTPNPYRSLVGFQKEGSFSSSIPNPKKISHSFLGRTQKNDVKRKLHSKPIVEGFQNVESSSDCRQIILLSGLIILMYVLLIHKK